MRRSPFEDLHRKIIQLSFVLFLKRLGLNRTMADGADGADGNKVEEEREKLRKRVSVLCSRRSQRDGRLKPNFLFFSSLLLTKKTGRR